LVHNRFRTLEFVLGVIFDVKGIIHKNKKITLLFLLVSNTTYAKIIETKYSRLIISTIAHDLKTRILIIQNNLYLLDNHIGKDGIPHLDAYCAVEIMEMPIKILSSRNESPKLPGERPTNTFTSKEVISSSNLLTDRVYKKPKVIVKNLGGSVDKAVNDKQRVETINEKKTSFMILYSWMLICLL